MSELSYDPSKLTPMQKEALAKKHAEREKKEAGGFDLRSRITSAEGKVEVSQPYSIHINNGEKLYERPMGSGNLVYSSGEEAGRVEYKDGIFTFDKTAKHKTFIPEADETAEALEQLKQSKAEADALRQELAAIQAEKKAESKKAEAKADKADEKEGKK